MGSAFAGPGGMLTEMVDTMNLTLLSLGVDIQNATIDDATRAQEKLIEQRDAGIVRQYYGQDYTRALSEGDTWATMAWSGDVFQLKLSNPELEFAVPEEGGILWVTPMEILRTAAHLADAHAFLDLVYRPEIAAEITEWVAYVTPVPAVQDIVRQHAAAATKPAIATIWRSSPRARWCSRRHARQPVLVQGPVRIGRAAVGGPVQSGPERLSTFILRGSTPVRARDAVPGAEVAGASDGS